MEKEEIFEKARKDNDEMEEKMIVYALGISTIIIPILCIIFSIIRIVTYNYIISDLVAITVAQLSISQIYQAIKLHNKKMFFFGIITFGIMWIFIMLFICEVKV